MAKKGKTPSGPIELAGLLDSARQQFETIKDHRGKNVAYKLADILMSGLAMFQLKYPSLHAFEQQTSAERDNLRTVFGIERLCMDAQLRNVLDQVSPETLRPMFPAYFKQLQAAGVVEAYQVHKDSVVVALDGVEYFSSEKIHCDHCQVRHHKNGTVAYCHGAVCAVMICPGQREVFPLEIEEISKQDGSIKNDCERNATGRLLTRLKEQYPRLSMIATGDALYANAPCVRQLLQNGWHFVLNVKPDSHTTLFEAFEHRKRQKATKRFTVTDAQGQHAYEWTNNLPLCVTDHPDESGQALPLYRLRQILARQGIEIPESTLGEWVKVAIERLDLLYLTYKRYFLTASYLQIDEPQLKVLEESKKGKTHLGTSGCCTIR